MKTLICCAAAVACLVGVASAQAQGLEPGNRNAGDNYKAIEQLAAQKPQNTAFGLEPSKREFFESVVPGILAPLDFVTDLFKLGGVNGWTKFWYENWGHCTVGGRIGFLIGCVICMVLVGKAVAFLKELRG